MNLQRKLGNKWGGSIWNDKRILISMEDMGIAFLSKSLGATMCGKAKTSGSMTTT